MPLDPSKLNEAKPEDVLAAAARGHLGVDHRFLHAILDRQEHALPAVHAFANGDRTGDVVDLTPELIAIFRHWKEPNALPFLLRVIKEDPTEIPDQAIEAIVEIGKPALEPLLELYAQLEESESSEIAFILANLGVRDPRILQLLLDRLEYDLADTALLLSVYGDRKAQPALEEAAGNLATGDIQLKRELTEAVEALDSADKAGTKSEEQEPFDIWSLYPDEDDLPIDLLEEDERLELLTTGSNEDVRAAAAGSFFNQELTAEARAALLAAATGDKSSIVRGQAWEALMNSTEEAEIVGAMLRALRNPDLPTDERGGLLVGLAPEADRNEVRDGLSELEEDLVKAALDERLMLAGKEPMFAGQQD